MTTPSLPELTSWYSGPTLLQRIGETASEVLTRAASRILGQGGGRLGI